MVRRLIEELAPLEGVTLLSARDYRLAALGLDEERIVNVGMDCWEQWNEAISTADAVWPIAPERGGLLHRMSSDATRLGKTLLGTGAATVALCSSKYETIRHLEAKGVPTVPTMRGRDVNTSSLWQSGAGWVAKPDDGAGAEDVVLFASREALLDFISDHADFVVQPYFPGHAVSLSLLCRNGTAVLLACNQQVLSAEAGRFRYESWTVCGAENRRSRYEPIAQAVAEAIPGLWGYVGVDLIDTGDMALLLEVNPRLTTPYVGLSEAVGFNVAAAIISMATTDALPHPRYRREVEVRVN